MFFLFILASTFSEFFFGPRHVIFSYAIETHRQRFDCSPTFVLLFFDALFLIYRLGFRNHTKDHRIGLMHTIPSRSWTRGCLTSWPRYMFEFLNKALDCVLLRYMQRESDEFGVFARSRCESVTNIQHMPQGILFVFLA